MSDGTMSIPVSLAMRRSRSLDVTSARSELTSPGMTPSDQDLVRHARSMDVATAKEKKLDKYGFIVNMDRHGHVFDESLVEERIPTLNETKVDQRRVRKWTGMVKSWDSTTSQRRRLVRKRLRKGIPDSMRGKVWPLLGNVSKRINKEHPGLYQELVGTTANLSVDEGESPKDGNWTRNDKPSPPDPSYQPYNKASKAVMHTRSFVQTQDTIERDIHRTYPRHHMFHEESGADSEDELLGSLDDPEVDNIIAELEEGLGNGATRTTASSSLVSMGREERRIERDGGGQAALRRVLRAYSVYDREVGYCQGMNFIAGMFLTFVSEEESFWLLVAIMNDPPCRMRGLFGEGMRETHCVLYIAEKLTCQFLPKLAKHLEKENIHITMYATQWLLTLYTSSFPFDLVTRVWDCFLGEGWKVVYRVMLALLQQSMPTLMALSFEEILTYFRDLPDKVDGDIVMEAALKIPLKRRHIQKYESEWKARQPQQ